MAPGLSGATSCALPSSGKPGSQLKVLRRNEDEMAKLGQPYTSGRWLVKAGSENDFIARWTAFTQWSLNNAPGAESFVLIQDTGDPRQFISFGVWDNPEAVRMWRQRSEFSELLGECRALCEEFEPHDYTLAASPGR